MEVNVKFIQRIKSLFSQLSYFILKSSHLNLNLCDVTFSYSLRKTINLRKMLPSLPLHGHSEVLHI